MIILKRNDLIKPNKDPYNSSSNLQKITNIGLNTEDFKALSLKLGKTTSMSPYYAYISNLIIFILILFTILILSLSNIEVEVKTYLIIALLLFGSFPIFMFFWTYFSIHKEMLKTAKIILDNENKKNTHFAFTIDIFFRLKVYLIQNNYYNNTQSQLLVENDSILIDIYPIYHVGSFRENKKLDEYLLSNNLTVFEVYAKIRKETAFLRSRLRLWYLIYSIVMILICIIVFTIEIIDTGLKIDVDRLCIDMTIIFVSLFAFSLISLILNFLYGSKMNDLINNMNNEFKRSSIYVGGDAFGIMNIYVFKSDYTVVDSYDIDPNTSVYIQ